MQDIGRQLYSKILMIFAKVVIVVRKLKTKNKKYSPVGGNTGRKTFYEVGSRFYKSNQTNRKTKGKQICFGSYKLCNQVGKS
jgi:hypothetical protein